MDIVGFVFYYIIKLKEGEPPYSETLPKSRKNNIVIILLIRQRSVRIFL